MCKEMLELAERCERINGPCRQMDARIVVALGEMPEWARVVHAGRKLVWTRRDHAEPVVSIGKHGPDIPVPAFTASLDQAMTLVPEGDGIGWQVSGGGCAGVWRISTDPDDYDASRFPAPIWQAAGKAATPALALCAASLRARAQATEAE